MPASQTSSPLTRALLGFCWDSWAQMGLAHVAHTDDRRAADPEALVLFTLQVARADPRLFDELLDWLRHNEGLVGVRRLRGLARTPQDAALVDAALSWVGGFRANPRLRRAAPPRRAPEPLFGDTIATWGEPDPAFAAHGFVRGSIDASHASRAPDPSLPINLAFRLRRGLGVGARAEVLRYLLTTPASDASVQQVTRAAGFARRNVAEALEGLNAAGFVEVAAVGNERRYHADRGIWARLIGFDAASWPRFVPWIDLLPAARALVTAYESLAADGSSDYMKASRARDVADRHAAALVAAGVSLPAARLTGAAYWDGFVDLAERAVAVLGAG